MIHIGLFLLRIALGVIFIAHGGQKVLGLWGGPGMEVFAQHLQTLGIPPAMAYVSAYTEFVGGILLVLGFATRFASLAIAINMIVATWKVHLVNGFFINWFNVEGKGHGYEFNLALIAMALCLAFTGAGKISLDVGAKICPFEKKCCGSS